MIDRAALDALLSKYVEMKRLRVADAEQTLADPRDAMRTLAARFPGALREIDVLPMDEIDARIAALERSLTEAEAPIATWMIALSRYHAWLRIALQIRREAGPRTLEAARALEAAIPELRALDDATLAMMLRPPAGRLNAVVLARVALEIGVDAAEIESCLAPRPRRHEAGTIEKGER